MYQLTFDYVQNLDNLNNRGHGGYDMQALTPTHMQKERMWSVSAN